MNHALTVAAVFAIFALLHSLTVSDRFKAFVRGLLGERWMRAWYRLAFTAFSAAISATLFFVYASLPDSFLYRPAWYILWPMHSVQFFGVWLMFAATKPFRAGYFTGLAQAGRYLRTGETGGDIEGIPPGSLVTTGVYAVVRHPMYLAGILVFLFEPNITVNCLVVRILACAYFVYGGLIEDRRLVKSFGGDYAAYMGRVPMFNIVAGVTRMRGRGAQKA